jgi:hypothetical protein
LEADVHKFRLFAGWLLERSRDKDLNKVRSAVNRYLEDNQQPRALLGKPVARLIEKYREEQLAMDAAEGIESALNRVPCPEIALRRLVDIGEAGSQQDLFWVCVLLVMLLGWFRASTMQGIRQGDVRFARDGSLLVSVRKMKGRPDLLRAPGLVQIPDAPPGHPRHRVFSVLHSLLDVEPDALARLAQLLPATGRNRADAATRITAEFRRLVPRAELRLPAGAVVSSHSFREMGASIAMAAGYSEHRARRHGLWKQLATMLNHYVFDEFPFSRWLAELFDFLAVRR